MALPGQVEAVSIAGEGSCSPGHGEDESRDVDEKGILPWRLITVRIYCAMYNKMCKYCVVDGDNGHATKSIAILQTEHRGPRSKNTTYAGFQSMVVLESKPRECPTAMSVKT
nr:hypothetical protein CFP56_78747 [Quercus suber]